MEGNTREEILKATKELLTAMTETNGVNVEDVACAIFTTTPDLNAEFPAAAARDLGWEAVALLCGHEMNVPTGLAQCLRILVLVNTEKGPDEMVHVYLKGATALRPMTGKRDQPPSQGRQAG